MFHEVVGTLLYMYIAMISLGTDFKYLLVPHGDENIHVHVHVNTMPLLSQLRYHNFKITCTFVCVFGQYGKENMEHMNYVLHFNGWTSIVIHLMSPKNSFYPYIF